MRVQDEQVTFKVFKALEFPSEANCCFRIDTINQQVERVFEISHPLKACFPKGESLDTGQDRNCGPSSKTDAHSPRREFELGQQVLLYNSRLRFFPKKIEVPMV